jgi:UDP-N-acetylmuramyl pentapeptide phosphotransferase/UDP-N-acetylglucosamine-1-phosphate transferase
VVASPCLHRRFAGNPCHLAALTEADGSLPPYAFAAGAAAVVSGLAMALLLRAGPRLPQALPDGRTLHPRPVPRVGGLAIWAGFVPVMLHAPDSLPGAAVWLLAWLAVAAVSLADDCVGVRAAVRLAVQLAAATAVIAVIVGLERALEPSVARWLTSAGGVVGLVWAANLYNFMDGSDGLAATMAICGFAAYGAAAMLGDHVPDVYFALAAATLPFLLVNLPPARAFMGDVGSVPLGFLAGAFGLAGVVEGVWPAWFPLLVFLPFIADATVTLGRRLARGERVVLPHKIHYYQRLHQLGAGHRGTLLCYGVLMLGTSTAAVFTLARDRSVGWVVLAAWMAVTGLVFAGIDYHWRKRFLQQ